MEKVEVYEVEAIAWTCPLCFHTNIMDRHSRLVCENCEEEFEAE